MTETDEKPNNDSRAWTAEDDALLLSLIEKGTKVEYLALVFERTERSIVNRGYKIYGKSVKNGFLVDPKKRNGCSCHNTLEVATLEATSDPRIDQVVRELQQMNKIVEQILFALHRDQQVLKAIFALNQQWYQHTFGIGDVPPNIRILKAMQEAEKEQLLASRPPASTVIGSIKKAEEEQS